MIVGERIRARLALLQLSQSELARRTGLTQGTIAGLLTGRSRSSTHLHRIARELATTAAYLEGETDDPEAEAPAQPEQSAEVREMVCCFEALPADQRRAVLTLLQTMVGRFGGQPTVRDRKRPALVVG